MIIYRCLLPNGKSYIGQTHRELKERINEHIRKSKIKTEISYNYPFYRAIRKYGVDNLKWSIIDCADTSEELNEKEKYWISYYDTYILNKKEENELSLCARCTSPKTGIVMECYTTQPGVQLYTGNWMTGNFVGKNGQRYPARAALCLETQHYPDSPNKPEYPSTVLRPGETFQSKTIYKFSVE